MSNQITNVSGVLDQKEAVMAAALDNGIEGLKVIAQAMVDPIKIALSYQSVVRKLLVVDELQQGTTPRYERDPSVRSTVIPKRGFVPESFIEVEDVLIPTFEIAAFPTIRYSEIGQRRYYVVDRAQVKAKDSLQRQEDYMGFMVINAAVPVDQTITVSGAIQPENLNLALSLIEEHELIGAKIVMHQSRFKDVRVWGTEWFDQATQRDILMTGLYGHLFTADIHVSTVCPKNSVFILAPAQYVGAIPVRRDITVLPCDDNRRLRLGWVVYEEIGVGVVNDFGISKVTVE